MHGPSALVLPPSARPWHRPVSPPSSTVRLSSEALGLTARTELLASGLTDAKIRASVREGTLRRVARGWYSASIANPKALAPLRRGHRLTCISATPMHGIWTPFGDSSAGAEDSPTRLHVYRYRDGTAVPRDMAGHRTSHRTWPEPDAVASLPLALEHAMHCQSPETAAILLESAMHRGALHPADVQALLGGVSSALRSRIGRLSTASESGSETRVVRWLRRRGYKVEQQVFLDGVGYMDVYVAGLFLEIDGRGPHSGEDAFEKDRARDLSSTSRGLQVLRISYQQIWHDWEATQSRILTAITEVGGFGRTKVQRLLDS